MLQDSMPRRTPLLAAVREAHLDTLQVLLEVAGKQKIRRVGGFLCRSPEVGLGLFLF